MNQQILIGFAASIAVAACSETSESVPPAADLLAGQAIAAASCEGCHGMDGRGMESDIPNLAAQSADYLADALIAYRDGRRSHAALRDLAGEMSGADIRDVAAFYASLPALPPLAESAAVQEPDGTWSEGAVVAAVCEECHGTGGYSTEPGVPSLAGQQPAYLIASTLEYVSGSRGHAEKEAMLRGLAQLDIEKMAMYFASHTSPVREAPSFGDPLRGEPLSASCGECHGARGISHDPLVPSLAGQEPTYLVKAITAYRAGERRHEDMVSDRSDAEIEDIAAFYSVQVGESAENPNAEVLALAAKCNRCHGAGRGSRKLNVPELSGQNREYLVGVMKAYREEGRGSSMMHKMSSNYSDEMIEAIATYYSQQTPPD